jgi:hypothetical protein
MAALLTAGCSTGVDPSPAPGTLRVVLTADPADSTIVLVRDPVALRPGDSFTVTAFQGQVLRGDVFFTLFQTPRSYRQEDRTFDPLARTADGRPRPDTLFHSFLPPGRYDRIRFGLAASRLRLGAFNVAVSPEPGISPLVDIPVDFEVEEGGVTEVHLTMRPLASVRRFQNVFHFAPQVEVDHVRMLP